MRVALPALLLVACGGPAAPPAPPQAHAPRTVEVATPVATAEAEVAEPSLGIDWATVPLASDDDALALWRMLGLDGDNWVERLSLVPETGAVREQLAKALLRHGGFACERVDEDLGCGQVTSTIREPAAIDDFESPCLRRVLALWALDELDDEVLLGELQADLVAIAGLPAPEGELTRAAFRRVRDDELLLKMLGAAKRAGNHEVADESASLLSDQGLVEAGRDLHIDGAFEYSDPTVSTELHLHALGDGELRRETRIRVAAGLGSWAANLEPEEPERLAVVRGLRGAAVAGDCVVASAVVEQLRMIGVDVPPPPAARTLPALLWATCRMTGDEQVAAAAWKAVIDPRGLVVKNHVERAAPEPAPADRDDPDAEPPEPAPAPDDAPEVERIPRDDGFEMPFEDELLRALPGCTTATCAVPGSGVSFRVGTRKGSKGRLILHTLERFERPGC